VCGEVVDADRGPCRVVLGAGVADLGFEGRGGDQVVGEGRDRVGRQVVDQGAEVVGAVE